MSLRRDKPPPDKPGWLFSCTAEEWALKSADFRRAATGDIRRMIAAMPSPWQPIETAPKNHVVDLLFRGNIRIVDCIWYQNSWWSTEQGDPCVRVSNELGQPGSQPTHWMPIPAPPESK